MNWRSFILFIVSSCVVLSATLVEAGYPPFRPTDYNKKTAICKAVKRNPSPPEEVNISLRYVELSRGVPHSIIMVHGWPGLWSTWINQIRELENDYHLIIPDLRGFGESTHPGDVHSSSTMGDLVGDLVCILNRVGVSTVMCMGHDWGSQLCYEAARMRPDIFIAVIGIVVPYMPSSGPFIPMKSLMKRFPLLGYQIYFDERTEDAVAELDHDVKRTLRAVYRTADSPPPDAFLLSPTDFLKAYDGVEISPTPFLFAREEAYIIDQYEIQGFRNTLGFYMNDNRRQAWELVQSQGNFTIPCPVLSILPTKERLADWEMAMKLFRTKEHVPNLTVEFVKGAHWLHLENPKPVNAIIKKWLHALAPPPQYGFGDPKTDSTADAEDVVEQDDVNYAFTGKADDEL